MPNLYNPIVGVSIPTNPQTQPVAEEISSTSVLHQTYTSATEV